MPAPSPSPAISPVRCPILVSASSVRLTLPCDALPSRLTQAMIAQASRSSSIPNSSSNVMGSHLVLDQFAIAFTGEWRDLRYGTAAVPYTHLQTAIVVGVDPLLVVPPEGGQSINNAHSPYEIWR